MRRLLLVAAVVTSLSAAAAEGTQPKVKVKRHRWKCTFVGRMVICDQPDHPLLGARPQDGVRLHERTPPDFEPLVAPPASFR